VRVQPLQLDAGVGSGELPIRSDLLVVAAILPGGDLLNEPVAVDEKTVPFFKVGKELRFRLNHRPSGSASPQPP
jgi:hypothetical protein